MKILENYIAPTEHSQGDVGDIWIDKSTGDVYKCTGITGSAKDLGYITIGADATNTKYTWEKLGDGVKVTTFYSQESDVLRLSHDANGDRLVTKDECVSAAQDGLIRIVIPEINEVWSITDVVFSNDDYAIVWVCKVNESGPSVDRYPLYTSEYIQPQ